MWYGIHGLACLRAKFHCALDPHNSFGREAIYFGLLNSAMMPTKTTKPKPAPKADLNDWRDDTLDRMRALIRNADRAITEEQKWHKPSNPAGVPLWSHNGMICTGEVYKDKVKLTFAYGAALPDPKRLFNASLDAGTRRAIDIKQGEEVDAHAFKALIKAAVALNASKAKKK